MMSEELGSILYLQFPEHNADSGRSWLYSAIVIRNLASCEIAIAIFYRNWFLVISME